MNVVHVPLQWNLDMKYHHSNTFLRNYLQDLYNVLTIDFSLINNSDTM